MIGLILIYFVGKAFYDLAGLHQKSKWGFAILGVLSYYAGLVIGGVLIAIAVELMSGSIDDIPEVALGVMALPIGVLTCWGFYKLLQGQWGKPVNSVFIDANVLDGDLIKDSDRSDL